MFLESVVVDYDFGVSEKIREALSLQRVVVQLAFLAKYQSFTHILHGQAFDENLLAALPQLGHFELERSEPQITGDALDVVDFVQVKEPQELFHHFCIDAIDLQEALAVFERIAVEQSFKKATSSGQRVPLHQKF